MHKTLVLASTSIYRKILLEQLMIPFEIGKPLIDEDDYKHLSIPPRELAEKLALLKAQSLKEENKVIIGGDQLVHLDGEVLGKPLIKDAAIMQLKKMCGKTHELITSICIIDGDKIYKHTDVTKVRLKPLSDEQIKKYVHTDEPFDCAGSYKIEKHGISLVEDLICSDFTAIQGLPLIAISKILHNCGYQIP